MKKFNYLYAIMSILLVTFAFTSCTEDKVPPTVSLLSGTGFLTSDGTIEPAANFKVQVKGAKGDVNMKTLIVYENGTKLALERIIDGLNANPSLLIGADGEAFTKAITIKGQDAGTSDYLFVVEDENLLKDTVEISLTISTSFNVNVPSLKVYNADAPAGFFGSVDLQKGAAVASENNPDGDVQDFGVVDDLTDGSWQKKIKPENGTEMVIPLAAADFDKITDLETLIAAYTAGTKAAEAGVTVNKLFLFKSPSAVAGKFDYFIMKTLEVVETPPLGQPGGDNKDFYIFNLKGKKY
ncbi:MAG: hypothetical protein IPH57_16945 [Saprospiraceae bacterium]|nr:hypothetical protein [Saprospiraceae bacterium]